MDNYNTDLHEFGPTRDVGRKSTSQMPVKPSPSDSNKSFFCRICHEGDGSEALVAPCKCTGTVALIHTSCLEHWLTTSNSDRCEICKNAYKIIREPRSCMEYFQDSENQWNIRNLIADIICFFLLTPLLIVSTYLCALGANQYFRKEKWEAVGLVILSLFLLAVYLTWCHVTTRFHLSTWQSWRNTNQQIRLVPVSCNNRDSGRSRRSRMTSVVVLGGRDQNSMTTPLQIRMPTQGPVSTTGEPTFRYVSDSSSRNPAQSIYSIDLEGSTRRSWVTLDDAEEEEVILDTSDTSRIINV